jgi:VCBS repeat-containing protein
MTFVIDPHPTSQDINGILWGWAWGAAPRPEENLNRTFSFPTGTAEYTSYVQIDNFTAFTAVQQAAVRTILANVASFSTLTFTETMAAGAILRYANATGIDYGGPTDLIFHAFHAIPTAEANPPELGFGGNPPASAAYAQGDSWYGIDLTTTPGTPILNYGNPLLGSFQYAAGIVHETGHNLGLKHGHVTQMGHGVNFPTLPADHDSYEYSVMTYSQFPGDLPNAPMNVDNAPDHPTTFMQNDIAALQYLYGANYGATANNTDTTYEWSTATGEWFINDVGQGVPDNGNPTSDNFVLMTLWDGGGTDTYDLSNYTTNLSVDLNPGQWVVLDTSPAATAAQRADLGNDQAGGAEYFARGNIANALIDPNADQATENRSLIENANGGSGNDTLIGNRIGNRFDGNGGNDTIDGRDGNDTSVYSGTRANYTTSLTGGSIRIADNRIGSPDGTDTSTNVEFFVFADGTYTAAQVLNQPPVLSADGGSPHDLDEIVDTTNSVTPLVVSGTLAFTDPDSGDTHTASAGLQSATWSDGATIPGLTQTALTTAMSAAIDVDGTNGTLGWDFSLQDMFADFLAVSEALTVVYNVTVTDHFGPSSSLSSGSSTQAVTIVINGANDDVVVDATTSILTGSVFELPNITGSSALDSASGVIVFSDPDLNDRPTASIGGQTVTWQDALNDYTSELTAAQIAALTAAFTITPLMTNTNIGSIDWDYIIADLELDFLSVGESATVTTPVIIDDLHGGSVTQNIVVTLVGANDPPIAIPDSNGTAKGSTLTVSAAAGLIANDTDPDIHDQDDLSVVAQTITGLYGSVTINIDGSYTYVANRGSLPSKIVAQDVFEYTLTDDHGGTDTAKLYIVVFNPGASYQKGIDTTLTGGNGPDVLDGFAGNCQLFGGNGPDVLIGGHGNVLTGGNGPDTHLFRPDFGTNTILDFNVKHDSIQFDTSLFTSIADILSHTSNNAAGNAVIDAGLGDTVELVGVSTASLIANSSVLLLA